MERSQILILIAFIAIYQNDYIQTRAEETILSSILSPTTDKKDNTLKRLSRSYYDQRYGSPRPLYDRLEEGPSRCGRCPEDRYDRDDYDRRDKDRDRDRYDDDRRPSHRPTYGNRYDRNNEDDDRKYGTAERRNNGKNETDPQNDGDKKSPDKDGDNRSSGSRRHGDRDRDRDRGRDRDRNRDRERDRDPYDDRDRYRPDYYDRFLRDPYRDYNRGYYDDRRYERRPLYDRYDEPYASKYDAGYGYSGYRRPVYDDRFDRGGLGGYDDGYGGYAPGVGRGPHDSFRPWDETYRGQAGWDAGGRGYYFASGRPDTAPATSWNRNQYGSSRPESSGWQNLDYSGYRDQGSLEYRGSLGYPDTGYRQDLSTGYARPSGWHSVGERRPYRDESGVNSLDKPKFDQNRIQDYNQNRQPATFGQLNNANYGQTSTTPATSYLYQRADEQVTEKPENSTQSHN